MQTCPFKHKYQVVFWYINWNTANLNGEKEKVELFFDDEELAKKIYYYTIQREYVIYEHTHNEFHRFIRGYLKRINEETGNYNAYKSYYFCYRDIREANRVHSEQHKPFSCLKLLVDGKMFLRESEENEDE